MLMVKSSEHRLDQDEVGDVGSDREKRPCWLLKSSVERHTYHAALR